VLARELSISQIKEIADQTNVKLEAFVHGALCVSYSGQCYLSQALCNRSANKGVCAQLCRLPYSLSDAKGRIIVADKHLLSLQDLNLSGYLQELIDAGISSFKIEGRLKEASYVKNITAFYRQKLDQLIEGSTTYKKSSSGRCRFTFLPDPEKSFHRGATDYFIHDRKKEITSFDSPKSSGEYIGTVLSSSPRSITIESKKTITNGDGFCYFDAKGSFFGFKSNRITGNEIIPFETLSIPKGTKIYRNYDHAFEKLLSKKSAERKISATIEFRETEQGYALEATDEDNNTVTLSKNSLKEPAQNASKARETILSQLSKTGNTIFEIEKIDISPDFSYFIPLSSLAEWRRELIELLAEERKNNFPLRRTTFPQTSHPYPSKKLDYKGNIHNEKAHQFYQTHQVEEIEDSFEKRTRKNVPLMFCKHCIKYSLGLCPNSRTNKEIYQEPFFLLYNQREKLQLHFDCRQCEMTIF
jgi:putative protease